MGRKLLEAEVFIGQGKTISQASRHNGSLADNSNFQ